MGNKRAAQHGVNGTYAGNSNPGLPFFRITAIVDWLVGD